MKYIKKLEELIVGAGMQNWLGEFTDLVLV